MALRLAITLLASSVLALPAGDLLERQADCSKAKTNVPAVNDAKLPDPFTFADGSKVTTKTDWACRQTEIQNAFKQYELGDFPGPPSKVEASLSGNTLNLRVTQGSSTISMSASIQKPSGSGPFPAIIGIGGASIPIPGTVAQVTFNNDQFAAQNGQSSRGQGLFYNLFGSGHSAGALTAWAWGVGRIIDGLEQLGTAATGIDTKRLGVTGCSRNGKGAFVVGALEKRIALTIPQESGSGGAACWRISDSEKNKGKNIQTAGQIVGENVWFSPNFNTWTSRTSQMPEDHHLLAGLVAPRGLYVAENDIDWLGPVSTTGCMKAGRQIYQALGVPENMGFSLVGGHNHCQFPSSQNSELTQYINYFLLNSATKPSITERSTVNVNLQDYASWTAPTLS
ncbi:4-O-methyl-glucuronoyl methylesterase [Colletotrichum sp. SAR 10_70]|nr:4-O-methyl-glucuronoyl methylesterase [Colletotrichum siamense]KAI8152253.1 4-O-methyl-glucuronoyl methylesterase [Colletotrichum sp. SAR 10_71]KAI8154272.1 4-O-methyl-glucuronoyl methylesterase [Colletotrichum sp. SAR 10_70]KAI8228423.1 4-O-methyl-glucuronoyl methylesterase [Colletotrichum sp. SAR 10_86]KAJ4995468.1 4-O-methyl-glucuronoyl methylesterase [Colletotrichum sp. SAR 10_66]